MKTLTNLTTPSAVYNLPNTSVFGVASAVGGYFGLMAKDGVTSMLMKKTPSAYSSNHSLSWVAKVRVTSSESKTLSVYSPKTF